MSSGSWPSSWPSGGSTAGRWDARADGCFFFIIEGTADAWRHADAVVYLRIENTKPWKPGQQGLAVLHDAAVITVLKADPVHGPDGQTMTFLQSGSTTERPYTSGEVFIAFLKWFPQAGVFVRSFGRGSVYPVTQGRVQWVNLGRGIPYSTETLKIDDFIARLRALAKDGQQ